MPTPSIGEAVRRLAEATAHGVEQGRILSITESGAVVQVDRDAVLAKPTTDEVLRAGDAVYVQDVEAAGQRVVIHGKAAG